MVRNLTILKKRLVSFKLSVKAELDLITGRGKFRRLVWKDTPERNTFTDPDVLEELVRETNPVVEDDVEEIDEARGGLSLHPVDNLYEIIANKVDEPTA